MTFFELFQTIYGRHSRPTRATLLAAVNQIAAMQSHQPPMYDCWIEYRNRRLEGRHA